MKKQKVIVQLSDVKVRDCGRRIEYIGGAIGTVNLERVSLHRGFFVGSVARLVATTTELEVKGKYRDLKAFIKQLDLEVPLYGI